MKKLLLILLCAPLVGLGQGFDFNDLKGINSLKQFKKFSFEKEFTRETLQHSEDVSKIILTYAQGYNKVLGIPNIRSCYYTESTAFSDARTFSFVLYKVSDGSSHPSFNRTLEQVKKSCTFYDFKVDNLGIWYFGPEEYICYTCPGSKYPGKIGFARGEGSDYIKTFKFD